MPQDLRGKTCVVTGANSGIGRPTATELARRGARVILACRSEERARPVVEAIRAETGNDAVELRLLDLASLASVRRCGEALAKDLDRVDVLVNNAGLAGLRGKTADGFELHFGTNHLGHFLLTQLLLDRLKASAPARIVNVASRGHYLARSLDLDAVRNDTSFTGLPEYHMSKLCNVLFTAELARRYGDDGIRAYALNPGRVASNIWKRVPWSIRQLGKRWLMISNEEGARTTLHCATSPEAGDENGLYYANSRPKLPSKLARDPQLAQELWRRSEAWVSGRDAPAP